MCTVNAYYIVLILKEKKGSCKFVSALIVNLTKNIKFN
jgi:hypothetical protein